MTGLYGQMGALTSDIKPEVWSKLRMSSEKLPNTRKQHRTAKIFTSYRKCVLLNPFPVTTLEQEVELMHLLRMLRYCHKSRAPEVIASL